MASFRQRNNKWQARISRDGHPDQVKTFEAKADAERWARSVESDMDKGHFVSVSEAQRTTLADLIQRYLREVTPSMKSASEDAIRLKALIRRSLVRAQVEEPLKKSIVKSDAFSFYTPLLVALRASG